MGNMVDPLARYQRQTVLPEIGEAGQKRLLSARVLCVGAGGLGCPVLLYLAAAGVGTIGIIDHDEVDLSNLQRQVLYRECDVGRSKAEVAREQLLARNKDVHVNVYTARLSADNAEDLFAQYDVIVDATDNFMTKFLINDAAVKTQTPWVYGSILGCAGQLASFDPRQDDAPCYRCLFPHPPTEKVMNCAEAGVIGAVAGEVGTLQAMEVMKIIVDHPDLPPLWGRLCQIDVASFRKTLTSLVKEPKCRACSQDRAQINIKEEAMLNLKRTTTSDEVTPDEARAMLAQNSDIQLLDVRGLDEWDAGHIQGADHFPLTLMVQGFRPDTLKKDAPLILYCKAGVRSMQALHILKSQGYADVKSMAGGYDAWMMTEMRAA